MSLKKTFLDGAVIRQIDIQVLFVWGFTFFIACFDKRMALCYFLFLFFCSMFLAIINRKDNKR
jgi:hypothetical protein